MLRKRQYVGSRPHSLRYLLLLVVLVVVLPVFIVRAGLYFRWLHSQYNDALGTNLEFARAAAAAFSAYLEDVGHQELAIGEALAFLEPPTSPMASRFLQENARHYPAARTFHWVDPQGRVINSSRPEYIGLNVSDRPHFQQALQSKDWVLADLVQSIVDDAPIFMIDQCIRDPAGVPQGVVAAIIDPNQFTPYLLGFNRHSGGRVMILDRQRHIVLSDPHDMPPWHQRTLPLDDLVQQACAGREAVGVVHAAGSNQRLAAAYVPIGTTGWVAVSSRPLSMILGPLRDDMLMTGGVFLVVVMLSAGLAVLISRQISRGVKNLKEHAEAQAAGRLDHRAEPTGITELQTIVEAFNRTAASRQQAEQTLRESEEKFRSLAENTLACIGIVQGRRYIYANPYLAAVSGYSREELLQIDIARMIHPDCREMVLDRAARRQRGEPMPSHYEFLMITKDGRERWLDFSPAPILYKGQPAVIGIAYDITERKQAERALRELNETLEKRVAERTALAEQRASQLRAMAAELSQTEERERRRLAQMLHDDLQQLLAATKFHAGALHGKLPNDALRERLSKVVQLLDESIKTSRSLTIELSPPILYDAGLPAALHWLARWIESKHGLNVQVQADEAANPDADDVKVFLFQAARELLFNVAKHARTNRAKVQLSLEDGRVQLVVLDEGSGFNPDRRMARSGFGLFGMRERIGLLGGRMEVDSAPGAGTRVTLLAPAHIPSSAAPACDGD